MKKAAYAEMVKKQQAQADKAYDIQTNIMLQQVRAEEVTIRQVEKEHEVKVQDAEIQRRERELTATVLKAAEAERQRIETLVEAEKQRLIMEAEGHASAIRAQGEAEADGLLRGRMTVRELDDEVGSARHFEPPLIARSLPGRGTLSSSSARAS